MENSNGVVPVIPGTQLVRFDVLIEFAVQKCYHDLMLLSELLPRKSDLERKVELLNLCIRSRGLFIKLLALAKWASKAGKIEKCAQMSMFLDHQCFLFTDVADRLARMARETLYSARLPNLNIPRAVDVAVSGNYPRVPQCVRTKIIPPAQSTIQEKHSCKRYLNHKLLSAVVLHPPPSGVKIRISNGTINFRMPHLWVARLTLSDENWRVLSLRILCANEWLLHQKKHLENMIQMRMLDSSIDDVIADMSKVLTTVAHASILDSLAFNTSVPVEFYVPGSKVRLSYWKGSASVTVSSEPDGVLLVSHLPAGLEPTQLSGEVISASCLVSNAIKSRTNKLLNEWRELIVHHVHSISIQNHKINILLFAECSFCHAIHIGVDSTGSARVYSLLSGSKDLEFAINQEKANIPSCLKTMKYHWLLNVFKEFSAYQLSKKCIEAYEGLPNEVNLYISCHWNTDIIFALSECSLFLVNKKTKSAFKLDEYTSNYNWNITAVEHLVYVFSSNNLLIRLQSSLKNLNVSASHLSGDTLLILPASDDNGILSSVVWYDHKENFTLRTLHSQSLPKYKSIKCTDELKTALLDRSSVINYTPSFCIDSHTNSIGTNYFSLPNPCAVLAEFLPCYNTSVENTLIYLSAFLSTLQTLTYVSQMGLGAKTPIVPWALIIDAPVRWRLIYRGAFTFILTIKSAYQIQIEDSANILPGRISYYTIDEFINLVPMLPSMMTKPFVQHSILTSLQNEQLKILSQDPQLTFQTASFFCRFDGAKLHLQKHNDSALTQQDVEFLEDYFITVITQPPYRSAYITAFIRFIQLVDVHLKDCIAILRLENKSDLPGQIWRLKWCWAISPHTNQLGFPGTVAIRLKPDTLIFLVQISPIDENSDLLPNGENVHLIPIMLQYSSKIVSIPAKSQNPSTSALFNSIGLCLRKGAQVVTDSLLGVLWSSVKEMLTHASTTIPQKENHSSG